MSGYFLEFLGFADAPDFLFKYEDNAIGIEQRHDEDVLVFDFVIKHKNSNENLLKLSFVHEETCQEFFNTIKEHLVKRRPFFDEFEYPEMANSSLDVCNVQGFYSGEKSAVVRFRGRGE